MVRRLLEMGHPITVEAAVVEVAAAQRGHRGPAVEAVGFPQLRRLQLQLWLFFWVLLLE